MIVNVDGSDTYCHTGGKPFDPALPALVFIHGAQHDHSVWALQTRYFAQHGYGVLAPDLPGHGRSQGAALRSIEEMAVWLLQLLDAAGVASALLAGHSMGSLVALEACRRAPHRVRALALLGTTYPMQVSEDLLASALSDEQGAIDMVNTWSHSTLAPKPSCPAPGFYAMGEARRLMQRMSQRNSEHLLHTDLAACNAYANGQLAAEAARCPVLFILGDRDMMTPARSTGLLTTAIADGRVVRVDAGHSMMAEQPDAVLDALAGFAATLAQAGTGK